MAGCSSPGCMSVPAMRRRTVALTAGRVSLSGAGGPLHADAAASTAGAVDAGQRWAAHLAVLHASRLAIVESAHPLDLREHHLVPILHMRLVRGRLQSAQPKDAHSRRVAEDRTLQEHAPAATPSCSICPYCAAHCKRPSTTGLNAFALCPLLCSSCRSTHASQYPSSLSSKLLGKLGGMQLA